MLYIIQNIEKVSVDMHEKYRIIMI